MNKEYKQQLKRDMIMCYGLVCWGNELWKPDDKNILTMHHMIAKRDLGELEWENIAIISLYFHQFFNNIEYKDYDLANEINNLLQRVNRSLKPPTEEHYEEMKFYEEQANKKHNIKQKKEEQGKKLVKVKYDIYKR